MNLVLPGQGAEDPVAVQRQPGDAGAGHALELGAELRAIVAELQRVAGSGVPWLALNGYGVLSPVEGRSEIHNQSMALTVLR